MRDNIFVFYLVLIDLFFLCFSVISCIFSFFIWENEIITGTLFVIIMLLNSFYPFILFGIYEETCLVKGKTKKIYKQKKKLRKLELKKEYLLNKKTNLKESQVLKCEIKALELEMNNQLTICSKCGSMNQMEACFCSKCGNNLKSK